MQAVQNWYNLCIFSKTQNENIHMDLGINWTPVATTNTHTHAQTNTSKKIVKN